MFVGAATAAGNDTVSNVASSNWSFSPNGDGVEDGTGVKFKLKRSAKVKLIVRTQRGSYIASKKAKWFKKGNRKVKWSGRTYKKKWAWPNKYKLTIQVTNSLGTVEKTVTATADKKKPKSPRANKPKSVAPFKDGWRDRTAIKYKTYEDGKARLVITDPWGRTTLSKSLGKLKRGWHKYRWNGQNRANVNQPSGRYTYRIYVTDNAGNTNRSKARKIWVSKKLKKTNFRIKKLYVDLSAQTVSAWDSKGKKRFKVFVSTGNWGSPTPPGNYKIRYKKARLLAYSLNVWANNPSYFAPHYAFHGWPYTSSGAPLRGVLGRRASHGCIRMEGVYARLIHRKSVNGSTVVKVRR